MSKVHPLRRPLVVVWLVSSALLLGIGAAQPQAASADVPPHTDVMFVFDTTGSMGGALSEAQNELQGAMAQLSTSLPDVQFGLAEVNDYSEVVNPGGFEYDDDFGTHAPWTLKVPITPNQALVSSALLGLEADGGGDGPEAYGRGLFESATNPAVAWRAGVRGVIVLVADNVPHDDELNVGIPSASWVESPFNTGVDPGADNTVGTPDDLDWQAVLQRLILDGKPLEYVDYHGEPEFIPYWQAWAGSTGGSVITTGEEGGNLGAKLVEAVKAGASAGLPACPTGQVRSPGGVCVAASPPPPPPSNHFKIEPRISCAKGCHVVSVKIVFDSAGNVISESVLEESAGASASSAQASAKAGCPRSRPAKRPAKCKPKALIKRAQQAVVAGANVIQLKLTGAAVKSLAKKGKVTLKVRFIFTPTGGTATSSVKSFTVIAPKPKKHH